MNAFANKTATSKLGLPFGKSGSFVQAKLHVNQPGDMYEQEADAMADKVMRMSLNGNMHEPKQMTGLIGKSVQRKCSKCEEEEKKRPIMRKTDSGNGSIPVSSSFASSLNASKGGGSPLPQATKSFMENAFSTDFSNVKIHTDSQAAEMSKGISAKAFTYGNDIYFNSGEFASNTKEGKKLLAHELTHVVQQGNLVNLNMVQREDIDEISTPVPEDFEVNRDRRGRVTSATGIISGVNITLRTDSRGRVPRGFSGITTNSITVRPPRATFSRGRRPTVTNIIPGRVSISIRTTYRRGIDTSVTSAYGRGTTSEDQSSGNTSLRFHEGSHGTRILDFLRENPLPEFSGTTGMTRGEYRIAVRRFMAAMREYNELLEEANIQDVDCIGEEASFCEA
jgi:hypothetical protein